MLSKNHQKLIRSLHQKKFRQLNKQFIAEGSKIVLESIKKGFNYDMLFYTPTWLKEHSGFESKGIEVSDLEMKKISSLKSPPGVLALFPFMNLQAVASDITLVLDRVKDPGNLGTIIRTAHAFNCKKIICSEDSVDCYNPKVVQASMGSIFHIQIEYTEIESYLLNAKGVERYSFDLNGENLYHSELTLPAIILLGNESDGVSSTLSGVIDKKLYIPINKEIDSLNVSISQAIALAEFNRVSNK